MADYGEPSLSGLDPIGDGPSAGDFNVIGAGEVDLAGIGGASALMLAALKDEARAGEAEEGGPRGDDVDLMMECAAAIRAEPRWGPTGRTPNEWVSEAGARVRLTWTRGEVAATFLSAGWESKATFERALTTERVRVRSAADLLELGIALVEYGRRGSRHAGHGGGTLESTGALGAPAPMAVAPGSTALPVAPAAVNVAGQVDSGMLPTRSYGNDAGLDLYTVGQHTIGWGEWYDLPCGIAVQIPNHCWGMIIGRSSALKRRGLHVPVSVIDPGYRGPLFVQVQNVRSEMDQAGMMVPREELRAVVSDRERIGQLVLVPNVTPTFTPIWVDQLEGSERGNNGFGSTGR